MQACCSRRCKNPCLEKQGQKKPWSDFGFCTHLLWLGKWGPEKGYWILAMTYFFQSSVRVVQPFPGGIPVVETLIYMSKDPATHSQGFTCCSNKWFSSPQRKGVIMVIKGGQLPWDGSSKWNQESQRRVLHRNLKFQLPAFCGSFTAQRNLIFAVQWHLLKACNKVQPGKWQAQRNLCWMLFFCHLLWSSTAFCERSRRGADPWMLQQQHVPTSDLLQVWELSRWVRTLKFLM